jgi:hypothetical protein
MEGLDTPSKRTGSGPKARICYVCGRQYMLHSFDIHIKQCKELFLAREAQKDPRERKKLPEDPLEKLGTGQYGSGPPSSASGERKNTESGAQQLTRKELDELNQISSDAYNTEVLATCQFCGRTFLPEKLAIHNRSCTADSPARKVTDKVRRGNDLPSLTTESKGGANNNSATSGFSTPEITRPKTTSSMNNPRTRFRTPSKVSSSAENESNFNERNDDATMNLKVENSALVGHLGGSSGRSIRKSKDSPPPLIHKKTDIDMESTTNSEIVSLLSMKMEVMETTIFTLTHSLSEMKILLSKLQKSETDRNKEE